MHLPTKCLYNPACTDCLFRADTSYNLKQHNYIKRNWLIPAFSQGCFVSANSISFSSESHVSYNISFDERGKKKSVVRMSPQKSLCTIIYEIVGDLDDPTCLNRAPTLGHLLKCVGIQLFMEVHLWVNPFYSFN